MPRGRDRFQGNNVVGVSDILEYTLIEIEQRAICFLMNGDVLVSGSSRGVRGERGVQVGSWRPEM